MLSSAKAAERLRQLQGERTSELNPQKIYSEWKNNLLTFAKERDRLLVPKYVEEKRVIEGELKAKLATGDLDESKHRKEVNKSMKALVTLERKYHMVKRERIAVKNRLEGETLCRFWTRSNKQACPRDLIHALKRVDPT